MNIDDLWGGFIIKENKQKLETFMFHLSSLKIDVIANGIQGKASISSIQQFNYYVCGIDEHSIRDFHNQKNSTRMCCLIFISSTLRDAETVGS